MANRAAFLLAFMMAIASSAVLDAEPSSPAAAAVMPVDDEIRRYEEDVWEDWNDWNDQEWDGRDRRYRDDYNYGSNDTGNESQDYDIWEEERNDEIGTGGGHDQNIHNQIYPEHDYYRDLDARLSDRYPEADHRDEFPRGGRSDEEEDAVGEFWLDDAELDEIIAALDAGKDVNDSENVEPRPKRLTLEEHIEMVLDRKLRRNQPQRPDEDHDQWTEELEWTEEERSKRPPLLKGETSREDDNPRDLRKKLKGKKAGRRGNNRTVNMKKARAMNKTNKGKKNMQYNRHKFGNRYHTGQGNRQYRNICLTDPPDRYRTCFSRIEDPKNDLQNCDKIQRNSYNLGAQMYLRGRTIPEGVPAPYTMPFVRGEFRETRTEGKMHLSFFQVANRVSRGRAMVSRMLMESYGCVCVS